ncbi:MAG TPA: glycosyltransferase [Actinomycetota bacterium]
MSRSTYTERPLGASSAAPSAPALSRIAVIVPVYNGAHLIEGCLRALDAQTVDRRDVRVIVVDDGSTDGTRQVVKHLIANVRLSVTLIERTHAGPAAARNAGLAASDSPYVAFTDADVEVSPDWLERAVRRLDQDPSLAGIEGRTLAKGEKGTYTHQMENERGRLYMTCNMIYRREAIAGGFDERFRMAFLEDSDVAFGVLDRGGTIEFVPDVLVRHLVLHEGPVKYWREARKRFYNPLLFRKHPTAYRALLKPVVPAFPAPYLDYLGAVFVLAVALISRAWIVAVPASLMAAWTFRRVAHVLRAKTLPALIRAAAVPVAQTAWVIAGMIRFRSFDLRI